MNTLTVITDEVHLKGRGRFRRLAKPLLIYWNGIKLWIDKGFGFDGASVPLALWWWMTPWRRWVRLAAAYHDFLYAHTLLTRYECDRIFLRLLVYKAKQTKWKWLRKLRLRQAKIMYLAVRKFGDEAAGKDW